MRHGLPRQGDSASGQAGYLAFLGATGTVLARSLWLVRRFQQADQPGRTSQGDDEVSDMQAGRAKRMVRSSTKARSGLAADVTKMRALIAALGSMDGTTRHSARQALVAIGKQAVGPLIEALEEPNADVRWEAAKALGELRDPTAIDVLVRTLEDENFGVRWLAGEGLIAMERRALAPLLRALAVRSSSVWFREGAHHVLHGLASQGLRPRVEPVLAALDGPEPAVEAPVVAEFVLEGLEAR